MQRTVVTFTLILVLLSVAISTNGQQKAPVEFISPIGHFGVMLPPAKTEYYRYETFSIGGNLLVAWINNWSLDTDEVVIVSAIAKVDLEAKADYYLEALRDKYAPGLLINQKKTSFGGHPGLIYVVDSKRGERISRAMIWIYLIKNRVYLMSLTMDDKARTEEHLKLMSTFRLLSPRDMQPQLTAIEQELTPESLPDSPAQSRPTTDAQDAALKGGVKTVITESEYYFDGLLFGAAETVSVENYDEHGDLSKTVEYRDSIPRRVRVYGSYKGERAFREIKKVQRWPNWDDKNDSREKEMTLEPRIFTIKYKHDSNGQLLQKRVLRGGKETETASYDLKDNTRTYRYNEDSLIIRNLKSPSIWSSRMVSKLDANGNSTEDAYEVVAGRTYQSSFQYSPLFGFTFFDHSYPRFRTDKQRHEYIFDNRGNWIQRKTFASTKDKKSVPVEIIYRTIVYYP